MSETRDDILYAFHLACPVPSAAQIIQWCDRYQELADDIRGHAAVLRDWDAQERLGLPEVEPDAGMVERGRKRAMEALERWRTA